VFTPNIFGIDAANAQKRKKVSILGMGDAGK
jgi:hypothetical protein